MSDAALEKTVETEENKGTEEEINKEGSEDEEEESKKPLHLHTRTVPAMVMLFGGGAAAIFTFIRHDSLLTSLEIIFVALVIFLALGDVIKIFLDSITIEEKEEETGEEDKVIERSRGMDAGDQTSDGNEGENSPEQVEL